VERRRKGYEAILIAKMDVLPSAPGPWIMASTTHTTDSPLLPVLDDTENCNCFHKGHKLCFKFFDDKSDASQMAMDNLALDSDHSDAGSDQSARSGDDTDTDTDVSSQQHHSILVHCAGSAFNRFQPTLCELGSLGATMSTIKLCLEPEPDNIKDKNALLVKAYFNNNDHAIGYIPVKDLPRVHAALKDGTLTSVTIQRVSGKYQPPAGKVILTAFINLVKIGKWGSQQRTLSYNSPL
jgi:hypothetical protein